MLGKMFAGRYGIDRFSVFLFIFALIFLPYPYIWVIGVMIVGYAAFRAFSRNIDSRRKELFKFDEINRAYAMWLMKIFCGIKNRYQKFKTRLNQRKQFLFLKCPQCRKTLRLPRHKGRLEVTCPLCGTSFYKKT